MQALKNFDVEVNMKNLTERVMGKVEPYGDLCYLTFCGSVTYGTNTKDSDFDLQGFFIPHLDYILGIKNIEQVQFKFTDYATKVEGTIFDIRKLLRLLTNCNPNVLEMLFVRDQDRVFMTDPADKVLNRRHLFLSKKVKHTFGGYAHSQLTRMVALNKYVAQNPDRIARVEKFGYDTKNCSHLMRLLMSGYECLTEGELYVFRKDSDFLKQVRDGMYTYDQVVEMANKKFELLELAYINSKLPNSVDLEEVNDLLKDILLEKIRYEL